MFTEYSRNLATPKKVYVTPTLQNTDLKLNFTIFIKYTLKLPSRILLSLWTRLTPFTTDYLTLLTSLFITTKNTQFIISLVAPAAMFIFSFSYQSQTIESLNKQSSRAFNWAVFLYCFALSLSPVQSQRLHRLLFEKQLKA